MAHNPVFVTRGSDLLLSPPSQLAGSLARGGPGAHRNTPWSFLKYLPPVQTVSWFAPVFFHVSQVPPFLQDPTYIFYSTPPPRHDPLFK